MKRLWEITPALRTGKGTGPESITVGPDPTVHHVALLALRHKHFGFNFVPLVTYELDLICGLDILFLRPISPGILWAGDIDNRIKMLLDALAIPLASDDYSSRNPAPEEQPFYCLLEQDKLITKLSNRDRSNFRVRHYGQTRKYPTRDHNMHLG